MKKLHSTTIDISSAPGLLQGLLSTASLTASSDLPKSDAANDTAFTPVLTPGTISFTNLTTQPNYVYPDRPGAWPLPAQPFFDNNSIAFQPVGHSYWTGAAPLATHSLAVAGTMTSDVVSPSSSTTPPEYQDGCAWLLEPCQSIYHAPSSPPRSASGNEVGLVELEYSANVSGGALSPPEWATKKVAGADGNEMPPQNRARRRATKRFPKAARSVARNHHKPVARIPDTKVENAAQAGRGAERLATANAQEVHHQPLKGQSSLRGWAVEAADGQLTWFEGSVEEEVEHHNDSTVQHQHQQEGAKDEQLKIPIRFKTAHKALLTATKADWSRGAIQQIKCRLCDTRLKTWDDFKRHCDTKEAHPLKISFCDHCGDFFARKDSLERHRKKPPAECVSVTPEGAVGKRRVTQQLHKQFRARLERALEEREDIGMPFSQIIKEKYPESSKRRTGGSGS